MDLGEERVRRTQALMAVAALGLIVAGVVYLKPSMSPPQAAPSAADRVPAAASGWRLVSASFVDSNHGTVELYRSGPAPTISFLTSDGGKTWHQVARSPENGLALAAFLDSRTVVVQTTSNLGPSNAGSIPGRTKTEVSFDGGRNWLELADPRLSRGPGLPGFLDPLHAWWIDRASSPSTDTPAAIWRTTDGGRSWHRLAGAGLPGTGYLGQPVFIDQLHAALAWTSSAGKPSGLFVTNDGGDTWRAVDTPTAPLPGTRALSLILIKHGQRLLAWLIAVPDSTLTVSGALTSPDGGSLIDYTAFVSLSDDGGQTWSRPRVGPNIVQPAYFWAIPSQDNRGRLFLLDVRRLWISEDDGATWFARALQAPAGLRPFALVSVATGTFFALAVQTGSVGMVTPGSPFALIRSSDDGAHWSAVTLPRP